MTRLNGLVLTEDGKDTLEKNLGMKRSEFSEALQSLCDQMNLNKGTISEEGQMTTCPVHYSLSSPNGFYATQVVGTVIGTPEEVVCYLMMVHTSPLLKTFSNSHIGYWNEQSQIWVFSER